MGLWFWNMLNGLRDCYFACPGKSDLSFYGIELSCDPNPAERIQKPMEMIGNGPTSPKSSVIIETS